MTCKMILNSADTDFSDRFIALQSMKREQDADVHADVRAIIDAAHRRRRRTRRLYKNLTGLTSSKLICA